MHQDEGMEVYWGNSWKPGGGCDYGRHRVSAQSRKSCWDQMGMDVTDWAGDREAGGEAEAMDKACCKSEAGPGAKGEWKRELSDTC